jgi:diguanylate cyclase (GGDEF)-like protein/PAS domain S-box-containing protein
MATRIARSVGACLQRLRRPRATQAHLLEALDGLPEGIVILDDKGRYIAWNRQYAEMYPNTADLIQVGATLEQAVRRGIERGEYPEAAGREEEWLAERLARLHNPGPRYEQRLADGRCMLIEDRVMRDGGLVSLRVDITELKQREASFRLLFEGNPLPMFVCRRSDWHIVAANNSAVAHYGYPRDQLTGLAFAAIHCAVDPRAPTPDTDPALEREFASRSFRHVRRDGTIIEVEIKASSLMHGSEPCVLLAIIDVTERRRSEYRMTHLARHDMLTGLPNRFALSESMAALQRDVSSGQSAAVLVLDLDKFKDVNDTLGHAAGDALLKVVARRLRKCLREGDIVGRLGGDEYGVLLTQECSRGEAMLVAQRILSAMDAPIDVSGRQLRIGVSIGIAMMPQDSVLPDEIFRCADVAMYEAKQDGRKSYRFFERDMDEKLRQRTSLEADLAQAIGQHKLEVHYQPLLGLRSGVPTCMEALVRWRHPKRGAVSPGEFIPVAEATGMIADLGAFVLKQACMDACAWPDAVKVAVNVSALELDRPEFIDQLRATLAQTGLPPRRLQIEVTESAVMRNVERSIAVLSEIRDLGVGIAMDDFGTGYSSLCSLRTFPFDKIKIDRSFIHDASISASGHQVLASIVSLAQALGMTTTAEGVESIEQRRIVEDLNCDEMQGYLFSAARPLHNLQSLLTPSIDAA